MEPACDALANSPGHIDRVVQVVRAVPLGQDTHAAYVAEHDPSCPPELGASYDAPAGLVSAEAACHHVFVVLRMGSTPLRGKAVRVHGGGWTGLVNLFVT